MMKSIVVVALVATLAVSVAAKSNFSVGANSKSWAGSNSYFVHGMQEYEQDKLINALGSWGVKVMRIWVAGIGGCVKGSQCNGVPNFEDNIGSYNYETLAALDNVLVKLHKNGIKALIAPHDANMLNGANGNDCYGHAYGNSDNFYGSDQAKQQYDNRMAAILNYKSPNFGRPWSQMSDVILGFDIQNEPMIGSVDKLQQNDPDDWLCGRAGNMKKIIGNSGVKIATGGVGGSEYCCDHEFNIIDKVLYCDAIDILSVHGYMSEGSQWAYFIPSLSDKAASQGKHLMIEEWGIKDGMSFSDQVNVFNGAGVPWMYWEVTMSDQTQPCGTSSCCGGWDGFEIGITSGKGDVKDAVATANSVEGRQDWTGYVY